MRVSYEKERQAAGLLERRAQARGDKIPSCLPFSAVNQFVMARGYVSTESGAPSSAYGVTLLQA